MKTRIDIASLFMGRKRALLLGLAVGMALAGVMAACLPMQQAAKDPHTITAVKTGVVDGIEIGDDVCALIQATDPAADVQKFCANWEQWAPLVEHVLAKQRAKAALAQDAGTK